MQTNRISAIQIQLFVEFIESQAYKRNLFSNVDFSLLDCELLFQDLVEEFGLSDTLQILKFIDFQKLHGSGFDDADFDRVREWYTKSDGSNHSPQTDSGKKVRRVLQSLLPVREDGLVEEEKRVVVSRKMEEEEEIDLKVPDFAKRKLMGKKVGKKESGEALDGLEQSIGKQVLNDTRVQDDLKDTQIMDDLKDTKIMDDLKDTLDDSTDTQIMDDSKDTQIMDDIKYTLDDSKDTQVMDDSEPNGGSSESSDSSSPGKEISASHVTGQDISDESVGYEKGHDQGFSPSSTCSSNESQILENADKQTELRQISSKSQERPENASEDEFSSSDSEAIAAKISSAREKRKEQKASQAIPKFSDSDSDDEQTHINIPNIATPTKSHFELIQSSRTKKIEVVATETISSSLHFSHAIVAKKLFQCYSGSQIEVEAIGGAAIENLIIISKYLQDGFHCIVLASDLSVSPITLHGKLTLYFSLPSKE